MAAPVILPQKSASVSATPNPQNAHQRQQESSFRTKSSVKPHLENSKNWFNPSEAAAVVEQVRRPQTAPSRLQLLTINEAFES